MRETLLIDIHFSQIFEEKLYFAPCRLAFFSLLILLNLPPHPTSFPRAKAAYEDMSSSLRCQLV